MSGNPTAGRLVVVGCRRGAEMTLLDVALVVVALAGLVQLARCMRGER